MERLELRVPPPVVFVLAAGLIVGVTIIVPGAAVPFPGDRLVAIALVVLGGAVALPGLAAFRRARTTVHPTTPWRTTVLVTSGVYRITRNPMYLGLAIVLTGIAAWRASVPGLIVVVLFCAYITRFQIVPEERALSERFGDEFTAYTARVHRWLGRA